MVDFAERDALEENCRQHDVESVGTIGAAGLIRTHLKLAVAIDEGWWQCANVLFVVGMLVKR